MKLTKPLFFSARGGPRELEGPHDDEGACEGPRELEGPHDRVHEVHVN